MSYGQWEGVPKDTTQFLSATKNSPTGFYDFHKWSVEIDVARYDLSEDTIEEPLANLKQIRQTEESARKLFIAIDAWWHEHHKDVSGGMEPSLTKEEIIASSYDDIIRDDFKRALQCIRYTINVRTYWAHLTDVNHPDSLFQKFDVPTPVQVVTDSP